MVRPILIPALRAIGALPVPARETPVAATPAR